MISFSFDHSSSLSSNRSIANSFCCCVRTPILRVCSSLSTSYFKTSTDPLYEYNKIFKSTHVLNLINDVNLRKAIRTARNRTEAYHQLQRLIRKVYSGVFTGKKISDNRISAHATRLVANCIVAYNALILNTVYEKRLAEGVSKKILEEFARISPLAWHHLFFTGRYSFKSTNKMAIDVAAMADMLEQHIKQSFWTA